MSYLDILFLIPAAWFAYKGFTHGLIRELFSILALALGIYFSFYFSHIVAGWIGSEKIPDEVYFAITFLLVLIIVFFIGKFFENIIKLIIPEFINNVLGAIFGILKVALVISALIFFIETIDSKEVIFKPEAKEKSFTYKYVQPIVPKIQEFNNNRTTNK